MSDEEFKGCQNEMRFGENYASYIKLVQLGMMNSGLFFTENDFASARVIFDRLKL